jgi:hypothetical protein
MVYTILKKHRTECISWAGISQSVQRLATGWTVRGSNPGRGETFRIRPDRPWGPSSLLHNGYRVFPGGKAAGMLRWPPTPSSAEVKERVHLYLYSTSGPSWLVTRWTLSLHLRNVYVNSHYLNCIHPWWCKQPHETQGNIPENQDEFLQFFFAIHITITVLLGNI